MLFSKLKKSLSDEIIYLLDQEPLSGSNLVKIITKNNVASKESVYRILRELLDEEVVNKVQKKYSLNRHWIQRMHIFSLRHTTTISQFNGSDVLGLNDGDSITYKFKNPDSMAIYWGHLYDCIIDAHPKHIPILIFHPHEWLIHARKDSEKYFLERFEKDKRLVLFSIAGNTSLDKKFKKDWSNMYIKINTGVLLPGVKRNRYLNILGDFIFEIRTTITFEDAIEYFFKENRNINNINISNLIEKTKNQHGTKLIFSRNKKRAQLLRNRLSKDFYIPSQFYFEN